MKRNMGTQKQYLHLHNLLPFLLLLILLSLSSPTPSSSLELHSRPQSSSKKLHFVLVHGACLGAWSWYKVTTYLQLAGHNVTALDMAGAGINPMQPESLSSLHDYYEPLLQFMDTLPSDEKVVLVGHSLGGLGISMAMEEFPEKICVAIFVTAAMPGPISSLEEKKKILEMYGTFNKMDEDRSRSIFYAKLFIFTEEQLATKLFPLSPPEDLRLATTLVRPQPMFDLIKSMEELDLTRDHYGSVKRAFIISECDEMTPEIMVWAMLILNKPDRVAEINGSDHMVMASKPLDLAQQLSTIAQDFASSTSM